MTTPAPMTLFKHLGRLEAFSDGVFAIALTLLILEIKVPPVHEADTAQKLTAQLLERWPSYFAFLLSFTTVLIGWVGHHLMLQQAKYATWQLVFANGAFLLIITFLPFPTALVAEHLTHPGASVACAVYAGAKLLCDLAFMLVSAVIRATVPDSVMLKFLVFNSLIGLVIALAAVVVAFFSPVVSLLMVAGLWLWWARPSPGSLTMRRQPRD